MALAMLGGIADGLAATTEQAPPLAPGQSRVWFMRQLLPGSNFHAPMVYVNGAPITRSAQGTAFFRDFTPGQYAFTVENCLPQTGSAQNLTLQPGGQYVQVAVRDDGHGMDEATRARIFEPLFSTKDIEKGSGLGLATVQSIVKKFGGSIRVESSPGNGARFWIYLPSVDLQQTSQLKGTTNPESP